MYKVRKRDLGTILLINISLQRNVSVKVFENMDLFGIILLIIVYVWTLVRCIFCQGGFDALLGRTQSVRI